jgi:hypothetical protein
VAGQVIERAGPAGDDRPPVADVDVGEVKFADGLGAGRVDSGQGEREAGGRVVAAAVAWLMSPGWSGCRRIRDRWPSRMPRAGSRKIVPAVLAWLNRERRAVRVCRRRLPDRGSVAVMTSPAVTSRRLEHPGFS